MTSDEVYANLMLHGTKSYPYPWMINHASILAKNALEIHKKYGIKKKNCIDLGCGVGVFCKTLAENDFTCLGIDKNETFIEVATKNWAFEHLKFLNKEIEEFLPYDTYAIVAATHQVVNLFSDFTSILEKMNSLVSFEGFLIFDLITQRGFETWQDVQVQERKDFYMMQKCIYDEIEAKGTIKLTGFVENYYNDYDRFDVYNTVYNHSVDDVVNYLKGLKLQVDVYNGNTLQKTDNFNAHTEVTIIARNTIYNEFNTEGLFSKCKRALKIS